MRRLGEGGFGSVYQAALTDGTGFEKLVALKMLPAHRVSADTLALLRDEARVAALLRDRAVVQVQAPIQLDGRWVVEMEYVDGASLARILKQHPTMPARPALEIIAEVARALDSVVNQPGPDGRPLMLVHRDIKPANLQLTPTGEVKILDFGAARSAGVVRESAPTKGVTGTRGYIAPERFDGIDDPRSDVYALGGVLHRMLTGTLPGGEAPDAAVDAAGRKALSLAARMRARELDDRMTAWDVEAEAQKLLEGMGGPRLREWAAASVPQGSWMAADDLVGQRLHPSAVPSTPPPSSGVAGLEDELSAPVNVSPRPQTLPSARSARSARSAPAAPLSKRRAAPSEVSASPSYARMALLAGVLGMATLVALGCGGLGGMLAALSGW